MLQPCPISVPPWVTMIFPSSTSFSVTVEPKWPPNLGPEGCEAQLKPIPLPLGLLFRLSFHLMASADFSIHLGRPDTSTTIPLAVVQLSVTALTILISTGSTPMSSPIICNRESKANWASTTSCPLTVPHGALLE